jgi:lipopolysaccharide export system protein LptC
MVTALSIALGSVLLFEPFSNTDRVVVRTRDPLASPDLELEDAVITRFRTNGQLKYRLHSPQIEHFETANETFLIAPELYLYSEPDPPWRITSKRGTISNSSPTGSSVEEVVLLEEDVRMLQKFQDGREFELRTPSITVIPDREYAETSRDVMITTHAGRTTAVGLQGDLNQGILHLFSNEEQRVHTIVLPDQFK